MSIVICMTNSDNITAAQIAALRSEAHAAGDLTQEMICVLALGGPAALEPCDPGTEADLLLSAGRDRDWARAQCARAISNAEAMVDG
jgi:hypothetical protein